jgi:hypothetical protein
MRKEFDLLSAQAAIPVLDRESLVGLAVFDGRVTGESLTQEELQLVFHLLEQLGQSVKNIWLHDQIASDHDMMSDILRQLSSGCVVVGSGPDRAPCQPDGAQLLPRGRVAQRATLEFSDLPQAIGSRVFEVLKSGAAPPPCRYQPPGSPDKHYLITATPFKKARLRGPRRGAAGHRRLQPVRPSARTGSRDRQFASGSGNGGAAGP